MGGKQGLVLRGLVNNNPIAKKAVIQMNKLAMMFLAALMCAVAVGCGMPPTMTNEDGGPTADASNPDSSTSPDNGQPMMRNCRSVTYSGDSLATSCTMDSQCCSGRCRSGMCAPTDIGGTCADTNDCQQTLGVCMSDRCGFMPMGTPCRPGTDDRMCAGGCNAGTRTCECGPSGRRCASDSDCCSGMRCESNGPTMPGTCG